MGFAGDYDVVRDVDGEEVSQMGFGSAVPSSAPRAVRDGRSGVASATADETFHSKKSESGVVGAIAYTLQFGKFVGRNESGIRKRKVYFYCALFLLVASIVALLLTWWSLVPGGSVSTTRQLEMAPPAVLLASVAGAVTGLVFLSWVSDAGTFARFVETASAMRLVLLVGVLLGVLAVTAISALQAMIAVVDFTDDWRVAVSVEEQSANSRVYGEPRLGVMVAHAGPLLFALLSLVGAVMFSAIARLIAPPPLRLKPSATGLVQRLLMSSAVSLSILLCVAYVFVVVYVVTGDLLSSFAAVSIALVYPVTRLVVERQRQFSRLRAIRDALNDVSLAFRGAESSSEELTIKHADRNSDGSLTARLLQLRSVLTEDTIIFPDTYGRTYLADSSIVELVDFLLEQLGLPSPHYRSDVRMDFIARNLRELEPGALTAECYRWFGSLRLNMT